MAPSDKLASHIPENTLLEKSLATFLPKLMSQAISKYKLKLATYPKFELVKAKDNEDWQIRAKTCEIPEFKLGNYKEKIKGALRAKSLWKPGDSKKEPAKPESTVQLEKEQEVIKTLLEEIKVKIPRMLIENEVNAKLSQLLEKIEKLGLSLDSYLSSLGKTADKLRAEYEKQARENIKLDLILTKVAKEEDLSIKKEQIDALLKAEGKDSKSPSNLDTPERRNLIQAVLKKRTALSFLSSLS
jgi:FKBP-type peptidyl-prolyl cis-trans isomerase (trigger factor)